MSKKRNTTGSNNNVSQSYGSMDVKNLIPKNFKQREFWDSLNENTITIAHGCAGTGKTLVALWYGLILLSEKTIDKIVYVRSDVGCDFQQGRGALKGEYDQKFLPLLGPVLDNLQVAMRSPGAAEYLISKGKVEPIFLEDVRGRSFNDCFVIVDEAQNITPDQVKTCLTRIGENSSLVLIGDTKQGDHATIRKNDGLSDAARRLQGIKGLGVIEFGPGDIVRNPLLKEILLRYEGQSHRPNLTLAA